MNIDRSMNIVLATKITNHNPILDNMNDCCFFTQPSFSLAPFFLPSRFLKYLITKLPPLPKSSQSTVMPYFLKPSPKSLAQAQILFGSIWYIFFPVIINQWIHLVLTTNMFLEVLSAGHSKSWDHRFEYRVGLGTKQ